MINRIWEKLKHQSLVLTAERGTGKTSILKKMLRETFPGTLPHFSKLEGVHTPLEFVRKVYYDVEESLSGSKC